MVFIIDEYLRYTAHTLQSGPITICIFAQTFAALRKLVLRRAHDSFYQSIQAQFSNRFKSVCMFVCLCSTYRTQFSECYKEILKNTTVGHDPSLSCELCIELKTTLNTESNELWHFRMINWVLNWILNLKPDWTRNWILHWNLNWMTHSTLSKLFN